MALSKLERKKTNLRVQSTFFECFANITNVLPSLYTLYLKSHNYTVGPICVLDKHKFM